MLRNIEPAIAEEIIRKTIAIAGVTCGVLEPPEDIEFSVLVTNILRQFRNLTPEEITAAFYLNSVEEFAPYLNTKKGERRVEHFQRMNWDFVSRVLSLYTLRKCEAFKIMKTKEQQVESARLLTLNTPKSVEETEEEMYNTLVDYCKREESVPSFWNWTAAYNHAERTGIISLSNDEKKELRAKVEQSQKTKREYSIATAGTIGERYGADKLTSEEYIRQECKRRSIVLHLQTTINTL